MPKMGHLAQRCAKLGNPLDQKSRICAIGPRGAPTNGVSYRLKINRQAFLGSSLVIILFFGSLLGGCLACSAVAATTFAAHDCCPDNGSCDASQASQPCSLRKVDPSSSDRPEMNSSFQAPVHLLSAVLPDTESMTALSGSSTVTRVEDDRPSNPAIPISVLRI